MSRDRTESLIRRPSGDQPAARAAETFQTPDPGVAARRTAGKRATPMHRTTVVYPPAVLLGLKLAAVRGSSTVGEQVRAALAAGLKTPAKLAAAASDHVGVPGTRTTIDLDAEQHRRLKVLAAERGVTVQSLVLAAVLDAHPNLR